jgi:hypothetical protein
MRYALGFDTKIFSKNISQIIEHDYGDFMRAANVYLNNLSDELKILHDKDIDQRLDKMQMYLQFNPNWNIESTREMLKKDTKFLDDLLHGHDQDSDSASTNIGLMNSK